MSYDKTCCGTTCDAKANAEYVAKLECLLSKIGDSYQAVSFWPNPWDMQPFEAEVFRLINENKELIKHAQQNHNRNGAS